MDRAGALEVIILRKGWIVKTPKTKPAAKQERTTITREEANTILDMVKQRTAKVPKALITRCLVITGDLEAGKA